MAKFERKYQKHLSQLIRSCKRTLIVKQHQHCYLVYLFPCELAALISNNRQAPIEWKVM